MFAYLDSSILMRIIFDEPSSLQEFFSIQSAVSSELIKVECLRTADRYRLRNEESESDYLTRVELIHEFTKRIEIVRVNPQILGRASQPFPIGLGTLDAIHLATGLIYFEKTQEKIIFCTHDLALKKAAKAMGFKTLG